MDFHWSLSDSKSPQVSRTLLSILAVINNTVVWMVSTRPPTSKSSNPFSNPLVTVPNAPITIGIIVTFMFHSFFQFPNKIEVLFLLFTFFHFILWPAGKAKSTILQFLFFFLFFLVNYYYYYYYYSLRVFPGVCVTASTLRPSGHFEVIWLISTMLLFGKS